MVSFGICKSSFDHFIFSGWELEGQKDGETLGLAHERVFKSRKSCIASLIMNPKARGEGGGG